jgi:GT2 family glycosyltransferase
LILKGLDLPLVSVIIPIYQDWQRLQQCLNALGNQTYPSNCFEVIVVDNDWQTDIPHEKKMILRDVFLTKETKPGSYAARNLGLRHAKGEIIAFTDSDCVPKKDWIEAAVNIFQDNPEISRIAGEIILEFQDPQKPNAIELYEKVFAFQQQAKVEREESAVTANMFAKKDVFCVVGHFNDSLMSGGDLEWGRRAAAAGFKITFASQVQVYHPARKSWLSVVRKATRVYGGYWELTCQKDRSKLKNLSGVLEIFKSATRAIREALITTKLAKIQRMSVIAVILFIKIAQFFELFRLFLGGKPTRV